MNRYRRIKTYSTLRIIFYLICVLSLIAGIVDEWKNGNSGMYLIYTAIPFLACAYWCSYKIDEIEDQM